VEPNSGRWDVRVPGRDATSWASAWDAMRFARLAAERGGGAEIVVHGEDGAISSEWIGAVE
jgi:hypothetical protein